MQTRSLFAWLFVGSACGEAVPPSTDQPGLETETDGIFTSGVDGGDGADETGEEPVYCITNDDNPQGLEGVKHLCDITYDLDIALTVDPFFGSNYSEGHSVVGVQTVAPPSTYEHPFVSACCTDITEHPSWPVADTCALPHQMACMSDLIEHVCHAPGTWLLKLANNGIGIGNGEMAIEAAAEDFMYGYTTDMEGNNLRQQCINHFMKGPDDLIEANLCGEDFVGGFDHEPFSPGVSWTYLGNTVFDVTITLRSSFATGGVEPPPTPAETCSNPPDNNGEVPPFSHPGSLGGFVVPVDGVPVEVYGPEFDDEYIEGAGDFGTDSRMHRYVKATSPYNLVIDQWVMYEDAASMVGTPSVSATVDGFKLELVGANTGASDGLGGWSIAAGGAIFNLSASIGGLGYSVPTMNDTDIDFHEVSSGADDCPAGLPSPCLVSSAFSIDYTDLDAGVWTLEMPEITWKPI